MKKLLSKIFQAVKFIKSYAVAHKIISLVAAIAVVGIGYWSYSSLTSTSGETRYVLAAVKKGAIITSVTGSGQVSASSQVDLKPKVSGDVVWVGIQAAQEVKASQALVSLDNTDAQKAVADAELSIEEAQLNLDKSTAQAPIDYQNKLDSLQTAKDNLAKEYDDVFSTVSNNFLSLPTLITYSYDVLYGTELAVGTTNQWNVDAYRSLFSQIAQTTDRDLVNSLADIAIRDYKTARAAYDSNFLEFKNLTLYSSESEKEIILNDTLGTTRAIAQSIKSEINLFDTIVDIAKQRNLQLNPIITTFQTDLRTYLTTANNNLSTLLSQQDSLKSSKATITGTENDISILKINNPTGVNPIDLQISKNSIEQQKAALADLKAKLADYVIRAPFDGVVADVNVKKGDSASSGTAVATLITHQKIAEISLNEIDAAKVKVGQKVTLTFDAIDSLSIAGQVSEIDTIGTVSQGVVTYSVKIGFDTQDDRVKSGMSVNAGIITDMKQDVLVVPSSAVKSQGGTYYVEMFDVPLSQGQGSASQGIASVVPPVQQVVEVGLSDDSQTEITNGLKEGDQVVSRTILPTQTSSSATSASSLFGGGTRTSGSGASGALRAVTR